MPDLPPHSPAMGQKDGEKWTAAADLQPTISKFDSLLDHRNRPFGGCVRMHVPHATTQLGRCGVSKVGVENMTAEPGLRRYTHFLAWPCCTACLTCLRNLTHD